MPIEAKTCEALDGRGFFGGDIGVECHARVASAVSGQFKRRLIIECADAEVKTEGV